MTHEANDELRNPRCGSCMRLFMGMSMSVYVLRAISVRTWTSPTARDPFLPKGSTTRAMDDSSEIRAEARREGVHLRWWMTQDSGAPCINNCARTDGPIGALRL